MSLRFLHSQLDIRHVRLRREFGQENIAVLDVFICRSGKQRRDNRQLPAKHMLMWRQRRKLQPSILTKWNIYSVGRQFPALEFLFKFGLVKYNWFVIKKVTISCDAHLLCQHLKQPCYYNTIIVCM